MSDEIQTGPYTIEVADPAFGGIRGRGSKTYTFDTEAELDAFHQGLREGFENPEFKIVERWGDKHWAYEDDTDQVFHTKVETFVRFCIDTNYEIHARNEEEAKEFSINRAQHEIKKLMEEGNVEALVPDMFELHWHTWMKGSGTTEVSADEVYVVNVDGPVDYVKGPVYEME